MEEGSSFVVLPDGVEKEIGKIRKLAQCARYSLDSIHTFLQLLSLVTFRLLSKYNRNNAYMFQNTTSAPLTILHCVTGSISSEIQDGKLPTSLLQKINYLDLQLMFQVGIYSYPKRVLENHF